MVLARILLARDREKEARAILEEARGSEELGAAVLASIYLMRLGDPLDEGVFAPLEDDPEWLSTLDRAEAHFIFWKSGGTRDHLERARSLLLEIRGRLSDDVARNRFDGVPLHREILAG